MTGLSPALDPAPIVDVLRQAVAGATVEVLASIDMPTIVIDREHFVEAAQALCDHAALQFAFMSDITAVDVLPMEPRYEIVYHLACIGDAFALPTGAAPVRRLRVKVRVHGDDPRMPSVTSIWPGAGWPEREVFDLFGIVFEGHPDLRRILMADDWQGHPLRKDYPVQIRKDTASTSALQLTAEEFAANVRAVHEGAIDQSRSGPFDRIRKEKA